MSNDLMYFPKGREKDLSVKCDPTFSSDTVLNGTAIEIIRIVMEKRFSLP